MDRYKLQQLLEWLKMNRPSRPPLGSYPGDPEGREPKPPYKLPTPPDWGSLPKWPPNEWPPKGAKPVPMPGNNPWGDLPEYDPESKWYNPTWRQDMEKKRGLPEGHLVHLVPPSQSERVSERFNLGGNFRDKRMPYFPREGDDWMKLLNQAQMGSEMGRMKGLRRENIPIPPGKRKRYPAEFDPATGQNRVVPGAMRTTYPGVGTDIAADPLSYVSKGPQLGGVPEGDKKFVDTMHRIQNAYFTGADFGYEEGWTDQLGVTQEQIDMFMAVPEEALQHAMDNPTDAVLQEFEEYYGFPLNVNDPDMQKYFEGSKKKRGKVSKKVSGR